MICPNCGYHAKETDKFCIRCATKLVPDIEAAVENAEEAVEEAAAETVDRAMNEAEEAAESCVSCAEEAVEQAENAVEETAEEIFEHEAPQAPEAPSMPIVPVMPIREEPPVEPMPEQPVIEHVENAVAPERLSKPLSTWGYIWRILLFSIPVLCMIPLFIMAFASGINKNSKSFARAVLIFMLVLFILAVCGAIYALVVFGGDAIVEYVSNVYHAVIGR